ncbi:MAG: DNA alkylation repair protein [Elusimicrobiota bacterium]|jgi:3-methyladenine DNA glycosylase AlkD|nr:DNA alkylation repair protein [Elusimicrobiota bacterium]
MSILKAVKIELKKEASAEDAAVLRRFFKTGKGQYGQGDIFIGARVPASRKIAKKYFKEITLQETVKLLSSKVHEHRLCALIILRFKFECAKNKTERKQIAKLYLDNTRYVNNWDLVDLSAQYILGQYFYDNGDYRKLRALANSNFLWEERIAIISTFYFIRRNDFKPTLELCRKFLSHKHDLIHKACGWMLREIGKRDVKTLISFLDNYAAKTPRVMLRYSVEKLPKSLKRKYMSVVKTA